MARMLRRARVKVDATSKRYEAAFALASFEGNESMVRLVLRFRLRVFLVPVRDVICRAAYLAPALPQDSCKAFLHRSDACPLLNVYTWTLGQVEHVLSPYHLLQCKCKNCSGHIFNAQVRRYDSLRLTV